MYISNQHSTLLILLLLLLLLDNLLLTCPLPVALCSFGMHGVSTDILLTILCSSIDASYNSVLACVLGVYHHFINP